MPDYYIPKGRAIGNPNGPGVIRPGEPIPPLTPEQIARFVADGSLAEMPEAVSVTVAASPDPPVADPPAEPEAPVPASEPSSSDGAGAGTPLDFPDPMPSIKKMPAHLAGKSAAYIRAMSNADSRASTQARKVYADALRALEGRIS